MGPRALCIFISLIVWINTLLRSLPVAVNHQFDLVSKTSALCPNTGSPSIKFKLGISFSKNNNISQFQLLISCFYYYYYCELDMLFLCFENEVVGIWSKIRKMTNQCFGLHESENDSIFIQQSKKKKNLIRSLFSSRFTKPLRKKARSRSGITVAWNNRPFTGVIYICILFRNCPIALLLCMLVHWDTY